MEVLFIAPSVLSLVSSSFLAYISPLTRFFWQLLLPALSLFIIFTGFIEFGMKYSVFGYKIKKYTCIYFFKFMRNMGIHSSPKLHSDIGNHLLKKVSSLPFSK